MVYTSNFIKFKTRSYNTLKILFCFIYIYIYLRRHKVFEKFSCALAHEVRCLRSRIRYCASDFSVEGVAAENRVFACVSLFRLNATNLRDRRFAENVLSSWLRITCGGR